MTACPADALAADHPTAVALIAEHPDPATRRAAAQAAAEKRRADLTTYRHLLIERDGKAPTLARLYATDQLLTELTTLADADPPPPPTVRTAPATTYPTPVWAPPLLDRVAAATHTTRADLTGRGRTADVVRARHVAAAVLRARGLSLKHVGAILNRDHTTVMASLRVVDADPDLIILTHALTETP